MKNAFIFLIFFTSTVFAAVQNSFTFTGNVTGAGATPSIQLTIYSGACNLYSQSYPSVTLDGGGNFSVNIDGTGTFYGTSNLAQVFDTKNPSIPGNPACTVNGTTATWAISVTVNGTTLSGSVPINAVPFAITAQNSEKIGGQTVSTATPNNLDILQYNAGQWTPVPLSTGTVTSVTSANSDISVSAPTSAPVLTLNSGASGGVGDANKIAKLDGSGLLNLGMFPTVTVAKGGTGLTSGITGGIPYFSAAGTMTSSAVLTQYQVVLGGGAGGAPNVVSGTGTSGQVLTSNGAGASPTWQTVAASGDITDVIAGTGLTGGSTTGSATLNVDAGLGANKIPQIGGSALTANSVILSNGTGNLTSSSLSNGQILIGSTGVAPVAANISGTASQILVTNGSGSITLSTPQNIGTTSSPTFSGLTLNADLLINGARELRFADSDSSNYVALRAPNTIGTDFSLRLPSADGTSGQVLITDGAGNLSWSSAESGIPNASSITTGLLTNTDWSTFNNKLGSNLISGMIFVGNVGNTATGVTMSGDAAISNTGALTIGTDAINSSKILDGSIVNADISAAASITDTKLATISTAGKVSGGAITSGTIGGSTSISTTGNITANALTSSTLTSTTSLSLSAGPGSSIMVNSGSGGQDVLLNPDTTGKVKVNGTTPTVSTTSSNGLTLETTNATADLIFKTNTTERIRISSGGNVGIGTTAAPATKLEVIESTSGAQRGISSVQISNDSGAARLMLKKAKGSTVAPTAVTLGDNIGSIVGLGYDGTTYGPESSASINITATENYSGAGRGAEITFWTKPNGTSSATPATERMIIAENGNIGIGTSNPTSLLHTYNSSGSSEFRLESGVANARISLLATGNPVPIGIVDANDSGVGFELKSSVQRPIRIIAGNNTPAAAAGNPVYITAQNASANGNGGDIILQPGNKSGSGIDGQVLSNKGFTTTACPTGYSLVNIGRSSYCISSLKAANTFINSIDVCGNDNAMICTAKEVILACRRSVLSSIGSGAAVWTEQIYSTTDMNVLEYVATCNASAVPALNHYGAGNNYSFYCCTK